MRSSLSKLIASPLNDTELFHKKKEAWADKVALVLTFEQLAKLNNKEYEIFMDVGNKFYGGN